MGSQTADDAGVVRLSDDLALVQTVDFFPPMVDDPHWFGRVGAANSISDVYAMGGTPVSAVSVFGLPADLDPAIGTEILQGAVATMEEAGIPMVGGHTVKDSEIKFGLCVTGTVHPDRIVANRGAKVGDVLVLTKPLGSGYLCTAIKRDAIEPDVAERVMTVMATLNKGAGLAMQEVGVHAATDITGYGLLGHAHEMAGGGDVTLVLRASDVPWIEGLEPYATPENTCGGLKKNAAYASGKVKLEGGTAMQQAVMADPQTSGGLLVAVAPDRLEAFLAALAAHGVACRAIVGTVEAASDATVRVV